MKTIKFFTLGCKANQYDTQSIRERFLKKGFRQIEGRASAGTYLINTCTVTAVADRKSKSIIRKCARSKPKAQVIVTGCLVEKDIGSLADIKGIDLIINKRFFPEGISNFCAHTRAFLKVQDGCDNFCSYCKVPLVRGNPRSRQLDEIIREAKSLVKKGFREIVLSGICLGKYGKDLNSDLSLEDLLEELEKIQALSRIRISSIEANDITARLIEKIKDSKKLCPHLHIPIQSGDDRMLKAMNRKARARDYLSLVNKLKLIKPELSITTDIIVGFPGEKEAYFQNTLQLIKDLEPLKIHIFPYSPRPGTTAFGLGDKIPPLEIKKRIKRLKKIGEECSFRYRSRFINKQMEILIERPSKRRPQFLEGLSANYIKILIKANPRLLNKRLLSVIPEKVKPEFVLAKLAGPRAKPA